MGGAGPSICEMSGEMPTLPSGAAPPPFNVGDYVIFLSDPDHVEWVSEIERIASPTPHWRVTTTWFTANGTEHRRICDADELELAKDFNDPRA